MKEACWTCPNCGSLMTPFNGYCHYCNIKVSSPRKVLMLASLGFIAASAYRSARSAGGPGVNNQDPPNADKSSEQAAMGDGHRAELAPCGHYVWVRGEDPQRLIGKTVRCIKCSPEGTLREIKTIQSAAPGINRPAPLVERSDRTRQEIRVENVKDDIVAIQHGDRGLFITDLARHEESVAFNGKNLPVVRQLQWFDVQADLRADPPEEFETAFLYRIKMPEQNWQVHLGYLDTEGKPISQANKIFTAGDFDDILNEIFRDDDLIVFSRDGKEFCTVRTTSPPSRAIQVYVGGDDLLSALRFVKALQSAYHNLGLHLEPEGPAKIGSLWQKLGIRSQTSRDETERLIAKAEVCVQASLMDEPMSRANYNQAGAVNQLMSAAAAVDNFVVLAGSVFMVKYTTSEGRSMALCKTLTPREILAVERNPKLLCSPEAAFLHLQELAAETISSPSNQSFQPTESQD